MKNLYLLCVSAVLVILSSAGCKPTELSISRGTVTLASKNNKYGFINTVSKSVVIPFIYDEAEVWHGDLCRVKKNNKYGFVDMWGIEIIPCIYDEAFPSHKGNWFAIVQKNDKWGCINSLGKESLPCSHEKIYFRKDGVCCATKKHDGDWLTGLVDTNTLTVEHFYSTVYALTDGLCRVISERDGKYGFIDKNGHLAIPCIYTSASDFENGKARVTWEMDEDLEYVDIHGEHYYKKPKKHIPMNLLGPPQEVPREICKMCKGTGQITILNGLASEMCPSCNGLGHVISIDTIIKLRQLNL